MEEIRKTIDGFPDRMLAGEVQGKTDRIGHFYGEQQPRLHLPLNFALLDTPWDALSLQANIDAYLNAIPEAGWPDWIIGGHDKRRIATKIGQPQARILAMLLLTLRGTPFFFAGDELGMEQVDIPPNQVQDPFEKLVGGYGLNRDPQRSPMRWDATSNGGFTYRRLMELRHAEPALSVGDYQPVRSRNDVLLYKRAWAGDEFLVAFNTVHQPRKLDWDGNGKVLLSTYLDEDVKRISGSYLLRPDEGIIVKLGV